MNILVIKFENHDHNIIQYTIEKINNEKYILSCFENKILPKKLLLYTTSLIISTNMFCNSYVEYYLNDILYKRSAGSGYLNGSSKYTQNNIECALLDGLNIMDCQLKN